MMLSTDAIKLMSNTTGLLNQLQFMASSHSRAGASASH